MKRIQRICCATLVAALLFAGGCATSRDFTRTDEVQKTGIIGKCFILQKQASLERSESPPGKRLTPWVQDFNPRHEPTRTVYGKLDAGTRLTVTKVLRQTQGLFGVGFSPSYATVARIETGPFAGTSVTSGMFGSVTHSSVNPEWLMEVKPSDYEDMPR